MGGLLSTSKQTELSTSKQTELSTLEQSKISTLEQSKISTSEQSKISTSEQNYLSILKEATLSTSERIQILRDQREEQRLKILKEQRLKILKEQDLKLLKEQDLKLLKEQDLKILKEQNLKLLEEIFIEIDLQIRKHKKFDSKNPLNYKCSIKQLNIKNKITDICNNDNIFKNYLQNNIVFLDIIKNNIIKNNTSLIMHADNQISLRYLTPFQGADTHRVFGHFKCNNCNKKWTSASSWKNKWQKCKKCDCKIYPYDQHVLEKDNSTKQLNNKLPHDRERCEKCIEHGKLCCPSMYY